MLRYVHIGQNTLTTVGLREPWWRPCRLRLATAWRVLAGWQQRCVTYETGYKKFNLRELCKLIEEALDVLQRHERVVNPVQHQTWRHIRDRDDVWHLIGCPSSNGLAGMGDVRWELGAWVGVCGKRGGGVESQKLNATVCGRG